MGASEGLEVADISPSLCVMSMLGLPKGVMPKSAREEAF